MIFISFSDDDTNSVDFVDRKINQYSDINLGDHNVADFLLDICEDYTYKPPVIQRPQFLPVPVRIFLI